MSSLRKGVEAGLAEAALSTPGVLCELIADGIHLPEELLRHAYGRKGWEGIALVSDATAGTGLGEGETFELGGIPCRIHGEAAWIATGEGEDRCLAGSTKTLFHCIRTMVEHTAGRHEGRPDPFLSGVGSQRCLDVREKVDGEKKLKNEGISSELVGMKVLPAH